MRRMIITKREMILGRGVEEPNGVGERRQAARGATQAQPTAKGIVPPAKAPRAGVFRN
jgi:hypothetical protein